MPDGLGRLEKYEVNDGKLAVPKQKQVYELELEGYHGCVKRETIKDTHNTVIDQQHKEYSKLWVREDCLSVCADARASILLKVEAALDLLLLRVLVHQVAAEEYVEEEDEKG